MKEMDEPWDLATIDLILIRFGAEKVASSRRFSNLRGTYPRNNVPV